MANENTNVNANGLTPQDNPVFDDEKGKKGKGYSKNTNRSGFNVAAMLKGMEKGYQVDGSISVPSQGNIIVNRAMGKNEKTIAGAQSNPGFARITYLPIMGSDKRQQTWASLAKQGSNLWRTIRSATPHAENYQPGDVMANLFITGGLRYGLAEAKRKIESLNYYSDSNQYIIEGIWRGLTNYPTSTTLASLQKKKIEWVNMYNGIVTRLQSVQLPDIFPIFHRWEYMSSTIFRDAEDESQSQFFCFTASHIYDWEVRSDPDDPGLDLVPISLSDDIDALLAELDRISIKVTSDSDMSDMFADLVLAYPTTQCMKWYTMKTPETGMKLVTVHDMNCKWALHNAQVAQVNPPTWHIVPEDGSVYGQIFLPEGKRALGYARPLCATNFDKMDMSKFFNLSQWVLYDNEMEYENGSQAIELINTPTEILTGMKVFWFGWDSTGERTLRYASFNRNSYLGYSTNGWDNVNPTLSYIDLRNWSVYLTFAYFPIFRIIHVQRDAAITQDDCKPSNIIEQCYVGTLTEIEKPFIVNGDQLAQARNAARVGLWNIPVQLINGKKNGNK